MAVSYLTTVSAKEILSEIQYHTLEPQDGGYAFSSGMWTTDDAIDSLMATYAAFIAKTKTKAFYKSIQVLAGQYRYDLNGISQGLVDILRVGWGSVLALQHVYVPVIGGTYNPVKSSSVYTGWAFIQAKAENTDRVNVTCNGELFGIDIWPGSSMVVRAEAMTDDVLVAVDLSKIEIRGDTPGDGVNVLYWIHDQSQNPALHREDTFAFDQIKLNWKSPTTVPTAYSLVTQPVNQMDLMPCPVSNGALNLWYTCIPGELVNYDGVLSGIAPEFNYHIKYGTMAMLLGNEGPCNDPQRAEYCDQRMDEGIELAQMLCDEEWA